MEVFYNGQWGTICGSGLYNNLTNAEMLAKVACYQLGFESYDRTMALATGDTIEMGYGPILLDNVICSGTEQNISQCSHNGWGNASCAHNSDLNLRCATEGALRLRSAYLIVCRWVTKVDLEPLEEVAPLEELIFFMKVGGELFAITPLRDKAPILRR